MDRFDILVIGAGPAGSAAAATAARAGLSVGLIDRAHFPRNKLCGGLFTGRSARAMATIFDLAVTPAHFLTCDRMRFMAGARLLRDMTGPPVHLTMRVVLDQLLFDRAVALGAQPITGQAVKDIDLARNRVTLACGTCLSGQVLIGADGVNSRVARALNGRAFDPATIAFGLEIEAPPRGLDAVEIDFAAADWGYGWAFPKRASTTIGVVGVQARNTDLKADMTAYVGAQRIDPSMVKYKGHFLPFGDYTRRPGRLSVLLAGDAAGLVDSITGEGIALAMTSGQMAAQAAQAALAQDRPALAFDHYARALRPIHHNLALANIWRRMIFPRPVRGAFQSAFAGSSSLPDRYLALLAGEIDYTDLRRDLLARLPKLAWRAARGVVTGAGGDRARPQG